MRIPCPYCGPRDTHEFVCRGETDTNRPDNDEAFYDYVYLRDNPIGSVREHWYHAQGCRNWLTVTRDSQTHEISEAVLAKDAAR
ncbi:MAG: sarcosine oxidase subunit delta [Sphingobium sp.]|jgi:heterotetrameric sarcosine oxidase delta subunit|nr:sarcosine oxidase subunit delta [Sphingobium sp.]MCI1270890.1 sarcosine oxidase subunit delta [Sphingobium sp.]MCI1755787.1 sarcosine oxidase subunit delta [Sphingobium sp.]MCI2053091.1 sarcosine oxidase subunit delta [Sphingobium sp.]